MNSLLNLLNDNIIDDIERLLLGLNAPAGLKISKFNKLKLHTYFKFKISPFF